MVTGSGVIQAATGRLGGRRAGGRGAGQVALRQDADDGAVAHDDGRADVPAAHGVGGRASVSVGAAVSGVGVIRSRRCRSMAVVLRLD